MYGSTITKMIQSAFVQPPQSRRRKMSAKTVIKSQNQMIHAKKIIIVQKMLSSGYVYAVTTDGPFGRDCRPERDASRAEADEGDVLRAAVLFQDLVGDAGQRAVEGRGVEHFGLFAQAGRSGGHRSLLTDLAGPA